MPPRLARNEIIQKDLELLKVSPREIINSLPPRVSQKISHWAGKTPTAPALRFDGNTYTYQKLGNIISNVKEALIARGVRRGDRVMIVCENSLALVSLMFALSELDAWSVIVNARLSQFEIDRIYNHCDPRLVIFTSSVSKEAQKHADRYEAKDSILNDLDKAAVTKARECQPEKVHDSGAEQVFVMIYTTGTTGDPKGVMLTHQNIGYVATVTGLLRETSLGDSIYAVLPISHMFGLSSVVMSAFFAGACVHLESRFEAEMAINALSEHQVSMLFGVPTMFVKILEHLKETGLALSKPNLRMIYAGGSPLDPTVKAEIQDYFRLPLHNGYGLTETGPTLCQTRLYDPAGDNSVGPILPGIETRYVQNQSDKLNKVDEGELWVRGPNIMKGYFKAPDLTLAVKDEEGWLNTGDLAKEDAEGNITIIGRTKEMIIRSGFNVYPLEVEAIINTHPLVSMSAVIGNPVDGDEEIVAFIKILPGKQLEISELESYLKEQLTAYKRPNRYIVLDDMPASPSGKVLLAKLKEQAKAYLK